MKSKLNKKITKEDLYRSPEFWVENIRAELFEIAQNFMDSEGMNRKELGEYLGVSKGYISQLLNGDTNFSLSKLVTIATSLNKAPYLYLKDLDEVVNDSKNGKSIYLDFRELETKAKRCDLLYSSNFYKRAILPTKLVIERSNNSNKVNFYLVDPNSQESNTLNESEATNDVLDSGELSEYYKKEYNKSDFLINAA